MFRGLFGYVDIGVLGLVALLALIALVSGFPDLVRYMKIRSM
jgi:hypothetical protein